MNAKFSAAIANHLPECNARQQDFLRRWQEALSEDIWEIVEDEADNVVWAAIDSMRQAHIDHESNDPHHEERKRHQNLIDLAEKAEALADYFRRLVLWNGSELNMDAEQWHRQFEEHEHGKRKYLVDLNARQAEMLRELAGPPMPAVEISRKAKGRELRRFTYHMAGYMEYFFDQPHTRVVTEIAGLAYSDADVNEETVSNVRRKKK